MLRYNNWSIEQDQWLPATEADLEQQLTFTNDYLCQTAHFEEHFSGSKRCCTYIKGIENPVLNISAISVRLQDERLDLAEWDVQEFYRCLHKNQPMLAGRRCRQYSALLLRQHPHGRRQAEQKARLCSV